MCRASQLKPLLLQKGKLRFTKSGVFLRVEYRQAECTLHGPQSSSLLLAGVCPGTYEVTSEPHL